MHIFTSGHDGPEHCSCKRENKMIDQDLERSGLTEGNVPSPRIEPVSYSVSVPLKKLTLQVKTESGLNQTSAATLSLLLIS